MFHRDPFAPASLFLAPETEGFADENELFGGQSRNGSLLTDLPP